MHDKLRASRLETSDDARAMPSVVDQVFAEYHAAAETGMWLEKWNAKRKGDFRAGFIARLKEFFDAARGGVGSMVQKAWDGFVTDLEWKDRPFSSKALVERQFQKMTTFYQTNETELTHAMPYVNFPKMLGIEEREYNYYYIDRKTGQLAGPIKHYARHKMEWSANNLYVVAEELSDDQRTKISANIDGKPDRIITLHKEVDGYWSSEGAKWAKMYLKASK